MGSCAYRQYRRIFNRSHRSTATYSSTTQTPERSPSFPDEPLCSGRVSSSFPDGHHARRIDFSGDPGKPWCTRNEPNHDEHRSTFSTRVDKLYDGNNLSTYCKCNSKSPEYLLHGV